MKKALLNLYILILPLFVFAQKHDYNWIFGWGFTPGGDPIAGNYLMSFHSPVPTIKKDEKKMNFSFYCGICSDSTGDLMYYTNGLFIEDKSNQKMVNGDTINPGHYWELKKKDSYPNGPYCYSLPHPKKPNTYVMFHMGTQRDIVTNTIETAPLYYSIIDMNLNNGLGVVVEKNKKLITDEDMVAPVAVKHGNGRDWWFITGILGKAEILTYPLNEKGVLPALKTKLWDGTGKSEYQSKNTISPDGRTYVRCDGVYGFQVYDFDRCNGTFSNLRVIPFADGLFVYSAIFAPDSKTLYFSNLEQLMSIDLSAPDPSATFDTLAYFDGHASPYEPFITGFWIPTLAPDGKIYYATTNGTLAMHRINAPGLPGQAADIEQHGVSLPGYNSGTMCQFPNYRLGEWAGSPCDTFQVQSPPPGFMRPPYLPSDAARSSQKDTGVKFLKPIGGKTPNTELPERRMPSMAEMALMRATQQEKEAEMIEKEIKKQ